MKTFIEKYFNAADPYIEYDINKHLASGWYVHYEGLTYIIMRKNIEGGENN